jgi:hypothetical protein
LNESNLTTYFRLQKLMLRKVTIQPATRLSGGFLDGEFSAGRCDAFSADLSELGSLWSERLLRGADFAETRIAFERWSRLRTVLYLAAMPALLVLVLARTGKDAVEGNWVWSYFSTLPLQFVGQLAWLIGEARASWRSLTSTRQIGSQ